MTHPSEGVIWFAGRMNRKFVENGHKRGWEYENPVRSFNRLCEEVDELWDEIEGGDGHTEQMERIIDECADIANFALMIAWSAARWKGPVKDLPPHGVFRTGPS